MKRKAFKIIAVIVAVLLVVLVGLYLYVSSGHFIQTQVLPRVAKALGTDVHADDAKFSALSRLELKNLRVGSEADPLLLAGDVRVRYRALALLSKKVEINEVLLGDVKIDVTPQKLEALANAAPSPEKKAGPKKAAKKPPEILVHNVRVQKLSFRYANAATDKDRMEVEVPRLDLDLPELAVGKDFLLTIVARAKAVVGDQVDAEIGNIALNLKGTMGQDLLPTALSLSLKLTDIAGKAGPVALDGRRIEITTDLAGSPQSYQVNRLGLVEYAGNAKDAEINVSGTLGIAPLSAALDIAANIPSGSLLDVVGALAGGLQFGQTAIAYNGHVDIPTPNSVASRGELSIHDLTVATSAANAPAMQPLQVSASHDVAMDLASRTLTLSKVDAKVSDGQRDVVTVHLDQAMALDLNHPGGDASGRISVKVDRLDLTMLNAFIAKEPGLRILSGELNRAVTLDIQQGGQQMVLNVGGGGVDKLLVQQGDRRIGPLRIDHEATLRIADFKQIDIDHFKASVIPLSTDITPAATVALDGSRIELGSAPTVKLNASVSGRGDRLAVMARPVLDDRSMAYVQPLLAGNVGLVFEGKLQAGLVGGMVALEPCMLRVGGLGQADLVDASLEKTSFALDDLKKAPEKVKLPVHIAVNNLELGRLLPFVPRDAGLARLSGMMGLTGDVVLTGPAQSVHLETKANIDAATFMLRDGTTLAYPVSPSLDMALDYTVGGVARLARMTTILRQAGRPDPLLHLDVTGSFDTSMNPNVRNLVAISTQGTVPLEELGKLVVPPEKTSEPAPSTKPAPDKQAGPPSNLWVVADIAVEKATYGNLLLEKLAVNTEYKNGVIDVAKAVVNVDGGILNAKGTCDLTPALPKYDFRVDGRGLQFAPVLSTFIPRTQIYTTGGIKQAVVELKGEGFDTASMQSNLLAKVDMQLDQLAVDRMSGTAGKLTEILLFSIFDVGWKDLSFASGNVRLAIDPTQFGDHNIHIQTFRLLGPTLLLDGSGTVQFGGKWTPDMEIKTGFTVDKAGSLRRNGYAISLEADQDGYYAGPSIPLKGDLTSLRNQASLAAEVLVRSGKLSRQDALRTDLANRILGTLSGESPQGQEKKSDLGELLGGIVGSVLNSDQSDEQKKKKNDNPSDAFGQLLQGIFGN